MEKGLVIKNISDIFTVLVNNEKIECKCRGKMRLDKQIPLVGDFVFIDKNNKTIEEILPRQNEILRPHVANITKGIIVTSCKNPNFSTNLLDKLLVELEINHIKPIRMKPSIILRILYEAIPFFVQLPRLIKILRRFLRKIIVVNEIMPSILWGINVYRFDFP